MRRYFSFLPLMLTLLMSVFSTAMFAQTADDEAKPDKAPEVIMHTSMGDITIKLNAEAAPKTVANFLAYVNEGFYAGTVFHRVIDGYIIQGGMYSQELTAKPTHDPVEAEADNGLSNTRGTIAVARAADPNSGTSQFFINLTDNRRLDFVNKDSGLTWGYTVFGQVTDGMHVVDKIASLPTTAKGPFTGDVPSPLVVIDSITRKHANDQASKDDAKVATQDQYDESAENNGDKP